MHKAKPYVCPVCGQEVPDLPMPVLGHQLTHARRRPLAHNRQEPQPSLPDETVTPPLDE